MYTSKSLKADLFQFVTTLILILETYKGGDDFRILVHTNQHSGLEVPTPKGGAWEGLPQGSLYSG